MDITECRRLSRILFLAREEIEMWADVVESRTGAPANVPRSIVREIDAYREEQGWNLHGFGDEEPIT